MQRKDIDMPIFNYLDATVTYKNSYKLIDDCHKMMNSMIDVGTDIGFYSDDHSWQLCVLKDILNM